MGVESAALLSNLLRGAPHPAEVCDLLKIYKFTTARNYPVRRQLLRAAD